MKLWCKKQYCLLLTAEIQAKILLHRQAALYSTTPTEGSREFSVLFDHKKCSYSSPFYSVYKINMF